jgi:hypothetical protein
MKLFLAMKCEELLMGGIGSIGTRKGRCRVIGTVVGIGIGIGIGIGFQ